MRGQLAQLVRPLRPTASVYIGLGTEDFELRWRRLASSLLRQGAPPVTVQMIQDLIRGVPAQPREMAIFATGDQLLWHVDTPDGVPFDRAAFGSPPLVLPLLAWLSHRPAYVEVVIDRLGGDVTAVRGGASSGVITPVAGPDEVITRGGPRGWDHPKVERRAVSSWRHNAGVVAAAVASAVKQVDAELLLVAGQPRIVHLMLEQLPKGLRVDVRRLPGGRSPDGSDRARHAAVPEAVAAHVASRPMPDLSVHGTADTLRALAAGQVAQLFVFDDPHDARVAWFGPDSLCAEEPAEGLVEGRMVDVAVRAALLTDAEVHTTARSRLGPEGIGAVCRFE